MKEEPYFLRNVFNKAVEITDRAERAAYVQRACGEDAVIRQRLERLLQAHAEAGDFLADPAAAPPSIREKPGDRIGNYKLLEKIGEGGCGVVYMAEQEHPVRRRVALKVIKLGMDTKEVIARLEAERQALALMDHASIAKFFDGGATQTGRPYFVMELVRGVRITDYCDQASLSTARRLDLFMQVCQAVQHAHQKGIIHRDIKPSNILVTVNDGVPVPKVIDFGIAKATEQRLTDKTIFTKFHHLIGTPAYMSPEQVEMTSVDIDTRSDIYSLGVLLYQLLTGRTPFDGKELVESGVEEMLRTIREEEPVRPSHRLDSLEDQDLTTVALQRQTEPPKLIRLLRGDLDWIVMMCLEKDRTRRYKTANALAMDIQRHLNHEPVIAGPPTAAYRLGKLLRKYRTAAGIAAAFLILLASASVVSLRLTEKANLERSIARRAESEAKDALTEMQIQRAEEFFEAHDASRGLAHLAGVLSSQPSNRVATARLLAALTSRNFCLTSAEPLPHESRVLFAQFSPDATRVVTASEDKTARVWDARTGRPLTAPLRHQARVLSALFSPDGRWVLTASYDNTAQVWDVQSGLPVSKPLQHEDQVDSAQFSPDGQLVATSSEDGTARVWEARTSRPVTDPLPHGDQVDSAQFSPDGRWIVTASLDQTARVWDIQTGQPVGRPLQHEGAVRFAQFSPDGSKVVTASSDMTARVWDARTGQPLLGPLRHENRVHSAQFSPDGLKVVTASTDKTARIWDIQTGKQVTEPLRHEDMVYSAQFSPDGLRVLTVSRDATARVWDARTGQALTEPLLHESLIHSAQFSPDGLRVVTASEDRTARVWEIRTGHPLTPILRHASSVRSAHFSPDGSRVVTASYDHTARVWDMQTGKAVTAAFHHDGEVHSAQFSPDGRRVVTASYDGTARVWNAQTGKPLTDPLRHDGEVRSACFSPEGWRVATASYDGTARVWDAQTGTPLIEPLRHEDRVRSAQFSPDGRRVVTASADRTARVWDAQTGSPITGPLRHGESVFSAQFSADGRWVVTASYDNTARVWDAQTGEPVGEPLRHEHWVRSTQFSPDGRRVATASSDRTARIWDAQTGMPLTDPLRHGDGVISIQFSPDGQRVITASYDGTARVWDARTGKPLADPLRHRGDVRSAQFSPDGLWIVTASEDNTARVWEAPPTGAGPVPSWLPQLAVLVAGKRLTGTAVVEPVPAGDFLKLKEQLRQKADTDFFTHWAQWFCADESARTISPRSSVLWRDYVQGRIEENTLESLGEAVALAPGNPEALARLALHILAQDPKQNPRRLGEAEFLGRLALKRAPGNPAVVALAESIERAIQTTQEGSETAHVLPASRVALPGGPPLANPPLPHGPLPADGDELDSIRKLIQRK